MCQAIGHRDQQFIADIVAPGVVRTRMSEVAAAAAGGEAASIVGDGKNDPNYQFPPEYQPYIVGTLPFDQIDKAYKGYRYAINLNSIKQSQTMFARRVFELLASNTITVSNFSRGVRLLFGDLVITTDSGSEMVRHLNKVANDDTHSRKLRLAALRKVMQEHT